MCDCFVPLFSGEIPFDDTVYNALSCVGEEFAMDICDCQDYAGTDCFEIPYVKTNHKPSGHHYKTVSTSILATTTLTTSISSESSWKTVTVVEIPLFGAFSILGFFLRRRKRRINE